MSRWAAILSVVAGMAIYLGAASAFDDGAVLRSVMVLDTVTWTLILTLSLINYGLRFFRWHGYLQDLGHRLPPIRHLAIYIAGFALTPTPGKLGEGVRAVYLKPLGVGYGRCLSALYAERLLDVMAVSLLAALLFAAPVADFRWLALVGGGIAVGLLAMQHPAALALARRLAGRFPGERLQRLCQRIIEFHKDVTTLVRARLLGFGLLVGLAAWAAEGLGLYIAAHALGLELGVFAAIGIYATAMLAGALSFIPGGLGSADATMAGLLVLSGAPLSVAVAATAIVRIATLWFAVVLGALAWLGIEAVGSRSAARREAG